MNEWPTLDQARAALDSATGEGISIAILDSGVETSHPWLFGLELADDLALVEEAFQIRSIPGHGRDLFGHGTAITAILRQVAPGARLGSFRVLGEQLRSRTQIIAEGVRQALDRGYHILNCSFGCGRQDHVLLYKDWVDEAYVRGRHIVASCNNLDYSKREWPGHFPTVLTVTFTNAATSPIISSRRGNLVEFAAAGQDVLVPWLGGGCKQVTGSSFAAPRVAGMLARLLSRFPDLSPLQAKALLQQLGASWPDNVRST